MGGSELDLAGGGINASTVSEALTQQLEATLLSAGNAREAARKVSANPKLMAEAREQLGAVSRLAQPIGSTDLYVAIQPLVIMFGPPDFGQDEVAKELQKAWFDLYEAALKDHPREAIDIAVSEWLRVGKPFFPKPTELNALAEATTAEIRLIAFRLRVAVEKAEEVRPPRKRTPEDAQVVGEMLASLRGPDGRIHLAKSTASATPPTDRTATAEALRRLAQYR